MSANRTFRVFISSTFEDFYAERELLRQRVWPELEDYCKTRGAVFEAVDLRWGIPANSVEDLDIVDICLNEVERCQKISPRPNFIAMIGNRYGWRPLPVTIPENIYKLLPDEAKEIVLKYYQLDLNAVPATYIYNKGCTDENKIMSDIRAELNNIPDPELYDYFFKSATHLEIDRGVLKPKIENMQKNFFSCFRSIEDFSDEIKKNGINNFSKKFVDVIKFDSCFKHDLDAHEWLEKLKIDIRNKLKNNPEQVKEYTTNLEDLSTQKVLPYMEEMCWDIEVWLKKMVDEELEVIDNINFLELEKLEHEIFKEVRTQTFAGRETLLSEIQKCYFQNFKRNVICIHGDGGSGKSALMSQLVYKSQSYFEDLSIIYRFIGASVKSVDLNTLLLGIIEEFKEIHNFNISTKLTLREDIINAFQSCLGSAQKLKTIIFIDALDQLNNFENSHSLNWLPQVLDQNITLVLSVANGHVQNALTNIYSEAQYFDISPNNLTIESNEAELMLDALLSKAPRRILQNEQVDYIVKSFQKNPLMLNLKLIAENARHWHSFDTIKDIEKNNLGVQKNVHEQIRLLFKRLSKDEAHGAVLVKTVLYLIALSREGVSDREISNILWLDDNYKNEFMQRKHETQPDVNALPPVIWSRLFFELEPFLMERKSGEMVVLNFFHRVFKEIILEEISKEDSTYIHKLYASYFSDEKKEPVRVVTKDNNIIYNTRKLIELPYHQSLAGMMVESYATLTDYIFLDSKIKIAKVYELMEDFQSALEYDRENVFPLLKLITKAFQNNINFIARHPSMFFQSIYNNCWWHDHPEKHNFYRNLDTSSVDTQEKLFLLMELWEKEKSSIEPGFFWLRSLQPPSTELDGYQISLLQGLSSPVIYVSYSEKEDKIFAVCNRGEFIVWDASTYVIEQFFPFEHQESFMFKPNSKKMFTKDTQIITDKGGVLADHPGFEYWAWSGIPSDDGTIFLSGSFDGKITLYSFTLQGMQTSILELDTLEVDNTIQRPTRGMAISNNNNYAATGHGDGSLILWDLMNKKSIACFKHQDGWVNSVALNNDASTIISGGGDNLLYVWRKTATNFMQTTLEGHTDRIWTVCISDDAKYAASGSDDKSVRIWNLESNKELKCLRKHTRWVQALAFSHDGLLLASSGGDGRILIWNVFGKSLDLYREYAGHDDSVLALNFSKDNKYLISGSRDKSVRVWDIHSEFSSNNLYGHEDRIVSATFSRNGQFLVTASNDNDILMWETGSGKPIQRVLNLDEPITSMKISNDDRKLIVGTDKGEVVLIEVDTLEIIEKVKLHTDSICSLDISSDSKIVVSADQNGAIKLWFLRTLNLFLEVNIDNELILSVSISPDSSFFLVGTRSGKIQRYEIYKDTQNEYKIKHMITKKLFEAWVDEIIISQNMLKAEARGGSWSERKILVLDSYSLEILEGNEKISDGAIGSFGEYRLGIGKLDITIKNKDATQDIAWYPKSFEFSKVHGAKRQWVGVQRYNLHHFRLEGGN